MNTKLTPYRSWLQAELSVYATACEDYVQKWHQSPPESLTEPLTVLREAWEAMEILVNNDDAYRPSDQLNTFLEAEDKNTGLNLYKKYVDNGFNLPSSNSWVPKVKKQFQRRVA